MHPLTSPLSHAPAPASPRKITNTGSAAVSGLSLIAHLPDYTEYMSLKPFPKLASGAPNPLVDGQALNWTGLSIPAGRTQTLKLAVAISSCAANTVHFKANITGANGCVTMAPAAQTTLKRSLKDKPCAPTVRVVVGRGPGCA